MQNRAVYAPIRFEEILILIGRGIGLDMQMVIQENDIMACGIGKLWAIFENKFGPLISHVLFHFI